MAEKFYQLPYKKQKEILKSNTDSLEKTAKAAKISVEKVKELYPDLARAIESMGKSMPTNDPETG